MFSESTKFWKSLCKASAPSKGSDAKSTHTIRRFSANRSGSAAIIFALAAIPVLSIVGAAVDYSNAVRIRAQMQAAVDAATLAGGRELQVSGDASTAWRPPLKAFPPAASDQMAMAVL